MNASYCVCIILFGICLFQSHFTNLVQIDGIAANVSYINLSSYYLLLKYLFNVTLIPSKEIEESVLNMFTYSCSVCNDFLARKNVKSEIVNHNTFSCVSC